MEYEELTPREIMVLRLLGKGIKNTDMAKELSVSLHTIKAHLESIYPKLRVNTRLQAVLRGVQLGILDYNDVFGNENEWLGLICRRNLQLLFLLNTEVKHDRILVELEVYEI